MMLVLERLAESSSLRCRRWLRTWEASHVGDAFTARPRMAVRVRHGRIMRGLKEGGRESGGRDWKWEEVEKKENE
jgi:hypothetical protein